MQNPMELVLAVLSMYKAMQNVSGKRDVIAAKALAHIFSDVREVEVVRIQTTITPKNKKHPPTDYLRYAVLLDKEWILDPVLNDLNCLLKVKVPEVLIVPIKPAMSCTYTDFPRFRIAYSICTDEDSELGSDVDERQWMPIAELAHDGVMECIQLGKKPESGSDAFPV